MDFKIYATVLIFSFFGTNALCGQGESTGQMEEGTTQRVAHSVVRGLFNDGYKKNTCEDIKNKGANNITNSRATESAKIDMGKQNDQIYKRCIEDRISQDMKIIKQYEEK